MRLPAKLAHIARGRRSVQITSIVTIGACGAILLVATHAITSTASIEAEQGTLSGAANSTTDTSTSNQSAVKFGIPDANNLPFALAAQSTLKASPKLVFAHYMTSFPISIDNRESSVDYYTRNFLNPTPDQSGVEAKHIAYGGFIRERPLPRAVSASATWQVDDMKTEVSRATTSGIDGFAIDILQLTGVNWDRVSYLAEAAHAVDPNFKLIMEPDGDGSAIAADPINLAKSIASVANLPAMYHLDDGRLVMSAWAPEHNGVAFWTEFLTEMKDTYDIDVAFVPTFLNTSAASNFASISYGFGNWGSRSPKTNSNLAPNIANAHAQGKIWMQPVSLQDERPKSTEQVGKPKAGVFDEANNTENFRTTWAGAIAGADWVQIPTWNDYSETTEISPSTSIGWSALHLNSYYLSRFKTGSYPTITKDRLYLSHRIQTVDATITGVQTEFQVLRAGSSPSRDTVEVLSFLPTAATVSVTVGLNHYTYNAPAGVFSQVYPLGVGTINATVSRSGVTSATVTSPWEAVTSLPVQDMTYHFAESK